MDKFEFQPFDRVVARDGDNATWYADLFSHKDETSCRFCGVSAIGWVQCVPYNEDTKHLIGTSDPYVDPAESPVFEFGDIVEVSCPGEPVYRGIFSRISKESGELRCSVLLNIGGIASYNMEIPLYCVTLIRKGNFNS